MTISGENSVSSAPKYLQAKIRIGSCKGPTSYTRDQQVFHHDDIPEERRRRKEEVREWAHSKTLSTARPEWHKSILLNKAEGYGYPVCERRQAENIVGDRSLPYNYNYRAETLDYACVSAAVDQPGKFHISRTALTDVPHIDSVRQSDRVQRGYFKRTQEMPTHPNIVDKMAWNTSTQLTDKEKTDKLVQINANARAKTAKNNKLMDHNGDYRRPIAQQNIISHTVRTQKENGVFVGGPKGTFNGHHVLDPEMVSNRPASPVPGAGGTSSLSTAAVKAAATKAAKTTVRVSTANIKNEKESTKNRYSIEPSRKFSTTKHSGVWEYSKADKCMMWSDTGSFVYDSRGDQVTTHNPDALNLEGPTLFRPSKAHLLLPVTHVDRR